MRAWFAFGLVLSLVGFSLPSPAPAAVTGAPGIAISGYDLVSSRRLTRNVYAYTYRADVSNWGTSDSSIGATLASGAANVVVVQGSLDFGDVPVGATRPSVGTFAVRVDRRLPFDTDALLWTAQATPLPPTTYALIDADLAAGTIGAETALLYRVYYEFHDSRLPPQYLGRDDGRREGTAIWDAGTSYDSLSPATQALLRPFLLPPEDPESWYRVRYATAVQTPLTPLAQRPIPVAEPEGVPGCVPGRDSNGVLIEGVELTDNGKVCIHYFAALPGDAATAASLSVAVNYTIWPALVGLFDVPPLDANGLLQIYLVEQQTMLLKYPSSAAQGLASPCVNGRPHVYLNRDFNKDLIQTATHELSHVFTERYNPSRACGEARWLDEATATWSEHFVYPGVQSEQPYAPAFLNNPSVSLETFGSLHEYGAYLWLFYATQGDSAAAKSGKSDYVRRVWAALESVDSLHAVDIAITEQDGLHKKWHEFALYDWNRDEAAKKPYRFYAQWDGLKDMAREIQGEKPVAVKMGGVVAKTYPLAHTVRHLAATYYHFDLTQDETIRRVRLQNPYYTNTSGAVKVQAIVKTDQGWQPAVDWTRFKQKTLCRDKSGENFKELVLVFSNSEFDDKSFVMADDGTQAKLQVSALGCANWKGDVTGKYDYPGPVYENHATTQTKGATFDFYSEIWLDDYDILTFRVSGGSTSWTASEKDHFGTETCSGDFSGSYSLNAMTEAEDPYLQMGADGHPTYQILSAVFAVSDGGSWQHPDYPLQCTNGSPVIASLNGADAWFFAADPGSDILPGIYDTSGGLFEGQLRASAVFHTSDPAEIFNFSWGLLKNGTFADDP